MNLETVAVFTAKSADEIILEGGTRAWRLDRNHARRCGFVVCTRNANAEWAHGQERHGAAFLVGKVEDVAADPNYPGRYIIQFSEFAKVNVPGVWKGERNPVKYTTLMDIGIDPSTLSWQKTRQPSKIQHIELEKEARPLSLQEAKMLLASAFNVSPTAIEITIRA